MNSLFQDGVTIGWLVGESSIGASPRFPMTCTMRDHSRIVGHSETEPLSDFFIQQQEIHRVVTCFQAPGIMLLTGVCGTLLVDTACVR
jgi:hypothetical protein